MTITATLDNPAPADGATVTLSVSGTATGSGEHADYTLSSTTLEIAAGETSATVTLTVIDDAVDDDDETIVLGAADARITCTDGLLP